MGQKTKQTCRILAKASAGSGTHRPLTFSCSGASGFNEDVVFLVALLKGRPAGGGDESVFRAVGLTAYGVH